MQLCDKASARQPRATFVLLASHCGIAAAGGEGLISSLMFKSLIIPGHPRFGHRFRELVGARRGGAKLGLGEEEWRKGWSVMGRGWSE